DGADVEVPVDAHEVGRGAFPAVYLRAVASRGTGDDDVLSVARGRGDDVGEVDLRCPAREGDREGASVGLAQPLDDGVRPACRLRRRVVGGDEADADRAGVVRRGGSGPDADDVGVGGRQVRGGFEGDRPGQGRAVRADVASGEDDGGYPRGDFRHLRVSSGWLPADEQVLRVVAGLPFADAGDVLTDVVDVVADVVDARVQPCPESRDDLRHG